MFKFLLSIIDQIIMYKNTRKEKPYLGFEQLIFKKKLEYSIDFEMFK